MITDENLEISPILYMFELNLTLQNMIYLFAIDY